MKRRYSFKAAEKEIVLDVNEKLSCVALDYDDQLKKAETSSDLERNYKLFDGQVITVGAERFGCQEVLFKLNFIGFKTSITKGRHKKGYVCVKKKGVIIFFIFKKKKQKNREIQGQARQHHRLCYFFGIEQSIACVCKMDGPSINYAQDGGTITPYVPVRFYPTNTTGKAFFIEMQHKTVDKAEAGDNVGVNLEKENMQHTNGVMCIADPSADPSPPKQATKFTA
ncbi:hypothetical protein RFI_01797 [Reticulomyxa filosa]|uniref:Uncharacterized protein n=1 Tax=Reticulomyxa filosa TaxID=46433 RepID=X6PAT9_RETFI|nr:hypothetical protein RFI_01797 [Reticulomyxa filosa]|eukprot:ETO35266.1 hypothetical protein RFI_01797 [Reticulomyxa filosa]